MGSVALAACIHVSVNVVTKRDELRYRLRYPSVDLMEMACLVSLPVPFYIQEEDKVSKWTKQCVMGAVGDVSGVGGGARP